MRRFTVLLVAMLLTAAMSVTAFADGITSGEARQKALKNAKLSKSQVSSLVTDYDDEDGVFEVEFKKDSNGARYEYDISASSGKILEKSIDYKYKKSSSRNKVGKTAARKKAAKKAGVKLSAVKKGSCRYEYDDREGKYEVKFRSGGRRYDVEIQAATGKVIEYSWKRINK